MQLISSLATLAAAISTVNALGSAIINNNCDFPVYLWPVDAQRNPSDATVISSKGSWSESYKTPSSGGVSLKLATTNSMKFVTQFEYTLQGAMTNPFVWYDGSNVDCDNDECPFWSYGINLKASDGSCPTRDCAVGAVCTGFYTEWNDDINTLSCADSADVIMTLCSVNQSADGSSSQQQKQYVAPSPAVTSKSPVINEAVATTFVTAYAAPSKRAEPVHHGHMHFHQRAAEQQ